MKRHKQSTNQERDFLERELSKVKKQKEETYYYCVGWTTSSSHQSKAHIKTVVSYEQFSLCLDSFFFFFSFFFWMCYFSEVEEITISRFNYNHDFINKYWYTLCNIAYIFLLLVGWLVCWLLGWPHTTAHTFFVVMRLWSGNPHTFNEAIVNNHFPIHI